MTSTPRRIARGVAAAAVALVGYDVTQRRHAIMRNYPLIGRLRYMLERVGPELRQYIVTDNDQERPFTRDQRRWVYATSKQENTKFGFGTDNDLDSPGYLLLRQSPFPETMYGDEVAIRKEVGGWRARPAAFTPPSFWHELAGHMAATGRGPDFVTVDGGEGGTGAAPLAFSDHVSLPFVQAFPTVYKAFAGEGLHQAIAFFGAGKLGLPVNAVFALAMGCDGINIAREAMLAIGCIQAQRCHTDHCPTGVATQNTWLTRGLDPTLKSVRASTYVKGLRAEMVGLAGAAGVDHPSLVPLDSFDIAVDRFTTRSAAEVLGYEPGWGMPPEA